MTGIVKSFDEVRALDGAGIELRRGEIHGLLGENGAGKTTLMNILYGLERPDAGTIEIHGRPLAFRSPKDAIASGIGMVHQHFMLVSDMTVAENVSLGLPADRPPLSVVDRVRAATIDLAARYRLQVEPDQMIESMSVGRQQRVELLKLLQRDAEILILDEPTAVLTPGEWEELAGILRVLADEGKSIVLITHKLDEILAIADRCTVLRDGTPVGTVETSACTKASLATMMVGREVVFRVHRTPSQPGQLVLEVDGVSLTSPGHRSRLDNVTLNVREGEILGIAGVEGNGQRELEDVLTGMVRPTEGALRIDGAEADWSTPADFVRAGGAAIPSDRHRAGVALSMSVVDNLIMREIGERQYSGRGIVRRRAVEQYCSQLARDYDVRAASLTMPMAQLSGGNQQKSVLARELARSPRLLIAAQPTRGLDVGAIEGVYERLLEHRAVGGATVLISSELEEVRALSDRIAVMVNGRILRTLDAGEADLETIGLLLGGAAR
jgi:simple sugar transport system ATP-binding protein